MLTWLVLPESWCCITALRVANVLSLSLCLNRGQVPRTRSSQSSERVDAALALLCDMTSSGGVARATRPLVTTSLEKHIENMLSCMSFIERSFRYPYLFYYFVLFYLENTAGQYLVAAGKGVQAKKSVVLHFNNTYKNKVHKKSLTKESVATYMFKIP